VKNNLIIKFLKHTVIGGLIFLAPLVIVLMLIGKAVEIFSNTLMPGIQSLPIPFLANSGHPWLIALAGVILVCFLAGLYSEYKKSHPLRDWFADNILSMIPGFSFIRNIGESFGGLQKEEMTQVIIMDIEETWQIGFLIEKLDDELCTAFIPGAPSALSGSLVVIPLTRVRKINMTAMEAMRFSSKLGVGAKKILSKEVHADMFKTDSR